MFPHPQGEVVFREAYAAQGDDAPVYFVAGLDDTHATLYPKDVARRTYAAHDPAQLCPPDMERVPLRQLRRNDHGLHAALRDAVVVGKYRTVDRLLKQNPLLDPYGDHAFPSLFHAIQIDDMHRWRKMVDVLLVHGLRLEVTCNHANCPTWSLLHEALQKQRYDKLDELHARGLPLGSNGGGLDLMGLAVRKRCPDAIGALLQRGWPVGALRAQLDDLHSSYDRYHRDTYQATIGAGVPLPFPHKALLRHGAHPVHLWHFFQGVNEHGEWARGLDHNGLDLFGMAERVGGEVAQRAAQVLALHQHWLLENRAKGGCAAKPGRRL